MDAMMDQSVTLMREANEFFAKKEPLSASQKYYQALHLAPDNAVALHNLAALQMGANSFPQKMSGLFLFSAAASLLKTDQYRADFAIALYNIGKPKQALQYLHSIQPSLQSPASIDPLKSQIAEKSGLKGSALKAFLARKPAFSSLAELNALAQKGQHERLIAMVEKQLHQGIRDFRVWHLLAQAYRETSQVHQAQGATLCAMALAPDNADLHLLSIELLRFGGLHYIAAPCARCSLQRFPDAVGLKTAAAFALADAARPEEAITLYEQATPEQQAEFRFRFAYANALTDVDRHTEAQQVALEIAREHPTNESVLLASLRILNKPGGGALMRQVFDIIDEHKVSLTQVTGHFYRAMMHNDLGETDEGLSIIEKHFDPKAPASDDQANFAMVAGKMYDKAGQYDKAFDMYALGNELHARMTVKTGRLSPSNYPSRIKALTEDLLSKRSVSLKDHAVPSAPDSPKVAFMYSFPRSGTTLLDTIFRTHTQIEVLEEQPIIRDTFLDARFKGGPVQNGTQMEELLKAFYDTDPVQLQTYYLDNMARLGRGNLDANKVYVDKMPLNTVYARLIKHMFPDAVHIFSLRDPADVITSCFAQNFIMNDAMYHFTSIEKAVAIYDQVMSFWVKAEEILDLDVTYVRYEELVTDLQGVVQPVIEHLGLPWEDGLVDFWKTAREREVIRTASADQVIQKLYTTSKGRWTRYSALKNGALEPLEPWRKHFGYA